MNQSDFKAWGAPLLDALREIEATIRDFPGDASMLNKVEQMIRELPLPDFFALGEAAGAEMEAEAADEVAARGRMWARHERGVAALAAQNPGFSPIEAAIKRIAGKTPVTSGLRSDAWERMPLALREAGQFSAGVESIRVMGTIQDQLLKAVSHQRELLAGGKERYVTRDSFIRTVRQAALDEGLDTGKGNVLTNIAAPRRIGLIHDMQKAQARGYARWKLDNDADALNLLPAWRLGSSRAKKPRPDFEWMAKWQAAGNAVGWEGAAKNQFVALKTSPIWMRLSRFGTPWPPFDWGSTRELEDVWRDEAEQLGLVSPADRIAPTMEQDFAAELEASVSGWRPDQISTLKLAFGDQVKTDGGRVQWLGNVLGDFYARANVEKDWKDHLDLGRATGRTINMAATKGVNLEGWSMRIFADDIRHQEGRHGVESADRNPISRGDVELIPHVWRDPDEITQGADGSLIFKKRIVGKLVVVEFQRSQKYMRAGIKTFRKEKA
ncbi:MAG TPA: hypothetical protein PKE26_11815 [Kiritimatiellia bacterium]|nr:hypothetical protein [Kiritimatiellia bacterium]HMO99787.1 hypothetical protein [Kiritimatiellia bacterium]